MNLRTFIIAGYNRKRRFPTNKDLLAQSLSKKSKSRKKAQNASKAQWQSSKAKKASGRYKWKCVSTIGVNINGHNLRRISGCWCVTTTWRIVNCDGNIGGGCYGTAWGTLQLKAKKGSEG